MYQLTNQQIDYILTDIGKRGIELEDLKLNLLDHICCVIENEYTEETPFEEYYQLVVARFYTNNLQEIEVETKLLLTFKHYYFMKKLMLLSGTISAALLILGIVFKFMYWPGASAMLILGTVVLCLAFLPVYFILKIKNESLIKDKILAGITSLVCIAFSFSVMFKVQHWPGANMLGISSILIMVGLYLPIYFITGITQTENRVSTITSSVLIVAGCALLLTLVRSPKSTKMHGYAIASQLSHSEVLFQNMMMKNQQPLDSISKAILATSNSIKQEIYEAETGSRSLQNLTINQIQIQDGAIADYFKHSALMQQMETELKKQIGIYNKQAKLNDMLTIPELAADLNKSEISIQTGLNNILAIQLLVLHNAVNYK